MTYIRSIIKEVLRKEYHFIEGPRLENRSRRLASRYQFDPIISQFLTVKGNGSGTKYVINDPPKVEDRVKELIEKESKPTFTSLVRRVIQEELGLTGRELKNKTLRFIHRFSDDSELKLRNFY